MNGINDPRSYLDSSGNCLLQTPAKFRWLQRDLCDAGSMLYQLSYEASKLGTGQFDGLKVMCYRERTQ